jgi:hypothetical protein
MSLMAKRSLLGAALADGPREAKFLSAFFYQQEEHEDSELPNQFVIHYCTDHSPANRLTELSRSIGNWRSQRVNWCTINPAEILAA